MKLMRPQHCSAWASQYSQGKTKFGVKLFRGRKIFLDHEIHLSFSNPKAARVGPQEEQLQYCYLMKISVWDFSWCGLKSEVIIKNDVDYYVFFLWLNLHLSEICFLIKTNHNIEISQCYIVQWQQFTISIRIKDVLYLLPKTFGGGG